jgi:peptidoglycan biosynthesis protein MviN/MurJ (putative lipid II flippase)
MNGLLIAILAGIVGIAIGIAVMTVMSRTGLDKAKNEAQSILDESNAKAENIVRQANLDGKQQVY